MDGRHPDSQDASGDIRVDLDSSTPCWNDAIGILVELTETHPASYISKKIPKATKKSEIFDSRLRALRSLRGRSFSLVVGSTCRALQSFPDSQRRHRRLRDLYTERRN